MGDKRTGPKGFLGFVLRSTKCRADLKRSREHAAEAVMSGREWAAAVVSVRRRALIAGLDRMPLWEDAGEVYVDATWWRWRLPSPVEVRCLTSHLISRDCAIPVRICIHGDCTFRKNRKHKMESHYQTCHELPQHECAVCLNRFMSESDLGLHSSAGHIGSVPMCATPEVFGRDLRLMDLTEAERELVAAFDPDLLCSSPEILSPSDSSEA